MRCTLPPAGTAASLPAAPHSENGFVRSASSFDHVQDCNSSFYDWFIISASEVVVKYAQKSNCAYRSLSLYSILIREYIKSLHYTDYSLFPGYRKLCTRFLVGCIMGTSCTRINIPQNWDLLLTSSMGVRETNLKRPHQWKLAPEMWPFLLLCRLKAPQNHSYHRVLNPRAFRQSLLHPLIKGSV